MSEMSLANLSEDDQPLTPPSLADLGPYYGMPRLDPGLRRVPGDTKALPAAETFAQVGGELLIPQTPLDVAMYALGGPFSRGAKIGALTLGALLTGTNAEPGPFGKLARSAASRWKRADEMGFRRDWPLYGATAPAGERVAEAAVKIGDRVFTGPSHLLAIDRAETALGAPFDRLPLAPIPDGFVTTSGRFVSRHEARDIAAAAAQSGRSTAMPGYKGLASKDLKAATASYSARGPRHTTASTAPGLPGGEGAVWLALEPGEGTTALWHRAARPAAADVSGRSLPEIHATLASAWDNGFDVVMLKNHIRPGSKNPETVIVVRNSNQLRSPRAMFDPAKKDSDNILAGVGGAAGGASLGTVLSGAHQESEVY